MPKIPGVTSEILKKKVLEALEGIGIKASDIMGKGTNVKRLTQGPDINPFKPEMLEAMRTQNKTMGDALDAFANEAKYIMNANDQETLNFLNNINTYKNVGGGSVSPQGVGSMFKAMTDLETSVKDLKKSTDEAKTFAEKQLEDALLTAQHGGDPFKVPNKKSFGGSMYAEGNMRTALREFLRTEFKNGRLNLNDLDKERVLQYSPMIEHDPILVFKRLYGDNSIKKVEEIVNVFEKGESFKHYEELLRQNVDDQFLKPLNQADVGDGKLVLTEAEEIKPKLPDDDDIPFYAGGRVGLESGGKWTPGVGRDTKGYQKTSPHYSGGDGGNNNVVVKKPPVVIDKDPNQIIKQNLTTGKMMTNADLLAKKTFEDHVKANEYYSGENEEADKLYNEYQTATGLDEHMKNALVDTDLTRQRKEVDGKTIFDVAVGHNTLTDLDKNWTSRSTTVEDTAGNVTTNRLTPTGMWENDVYLGHRAPQSLAIDTARVGLKYGTKKLFNFTKKQLLDAVNDIFPTGDRKYDAEMVSDALVENNPKMFQNKLRDDLLDSERTEIYGIALDALDAFNAEAKKLMTGKKGVGSLVKTTEKPKIDFEDPRIKEVFKKAGQKGMALSDAAKIMGYDMSKQKDYFAFEDAISGGMEGWPREVKEQVIRAKYGDVVDDRLLNNMLIDDDHFRLAEVFATVEQGMKMQETGMGGEEIVEAIKADIKRKPNAAGGGVGSMFRGV